VPPFQGDFVTRHHPFDVFAGIKENLPTDRVSAAPVYCFR
jgi:hypothetical protein